MHPETNDLPSPVNHVFVDYENVCDLAPSIIGNKAVHVTLLVGAQKTKLDASLVEKLLEHADTVELIRLTSSGRNALDFCLAYYLGRAVQMDPCGYFHLVSKDKGYDALVEHLRSKRIRARRHDDFSGLTFSSPAKSVSSPPAPVSPKPAPAVPTPLNAAPSPMEVCEAKVLAHLRKPGTKRPTTHKRLVSYLVAHLGKKISETEAEALIKSLGKTGRLAIDPQGKVTYHL